MARSEQSREAVVLGAKVRSYRREQGLSQQALATRLGVSASYLNLIENNRRPLPRRSRALTSSASASTPRAVSTRTSWRSSRIRSSSRTR